MNIWTLYHKDHGRMVVTDIRDVERNVGFGWSLSKPDEPEQQKTEEPKRRGRPPKVKDEFSASNS